MTNTARPEVVSPASLKPHYLDCGTLNPAPVNNLTCTSKYSWHCMSPWTTDLGTFVACGRHDRTKEWTQIVGPFQSVLNTSGARLDPSCPTYQAYKKSVRFLVDQDKRFHQRWSQHRDLQTGKRLPQPEEEPASPAKRPRLSVAASHRPSAAAQSRAQAMEQDPRILPCNSAPASQASPMQGPSQESLQLTPPKRRRSTDGNRSGLEVPDSPDSHYPRHLQFKPSPPQERREYMEYIELSQIKTEPVSEDELEPVSEDESEATNRPSLTDSECSDEEDSPTVFSVEPEQHEPVRPSWHRPELRQAARPTCSCRLPFCPVCLEVDNYANSEYGPDAGEPNQPDIDAINRANMMNTTK